MEISGKIIVATEPRKGISQRTGTEWVAQDFVIETHEQYPKRCVFGVFGKDRLAEFNIQVGEELTVSFDIDAHEYNGRWFNSLRAWRVTRGVATPEATPDAAAAAAANYDPFANPTPTAAPAPVAAPAPAAAPAPTAAPAPQGTVDDLPF